MGLVTYLKAVPGAQLVAPLVYKGMDMAGVSVKARNPLRSKGTQGHLTLAPQKPGARQLQQNPDPPHYDPPQAPAPQRPGGGNLPMNLPPPAMEMPRVVQPWRPGPADPLAASAADRNSYLLYGMERERLNSERQHRMQKQAMGAAAAAAAAGVYWSQMKDEPTPQPSTLFPADPRGRFKRKAGDAPMEIVQVRNHPALDPDDPYFRRGRGSIAKPVSALTNRRRRRRRIR